MYESLKYVLYEKNFHYGNVMLFFFHLHFTQLELKSHITLAIHFNRAIETACTKSVNQFLLSFSIEAMEYKIREDETEKRNRK